MSRHKQDERPRVNLSPITRKELLLRDALYVANEVGIWNVTHRLISEAGPYCCTTTTVRNHFRSTDKLKLAISDRVLEERYIKRFPYAVFESLMYRLKMSNRPVPDNMIRDLMVYVLGQDEVEKRSFKELTIDEALEIKQDETDAMEAMIKNDDRLGKNSDNIEE